MPSAAAAQTGLPFLEQRRPPSCRISNSERTGLRHSFADAVEIKRANARRISETVRTASTRGQSLWAKPYTFTPPPIAQRSILNIDPSGLADAEAMVRRSEGEIAAARLQRDRKCHSGGATAPNEKPRYERSGASDSGPGVPLGRAQTEVMWLDANSASRSAQHPSRPAPFASPLPGLSLAVPMPMPGVKAHALRRCHFIHVAIAHNLAFDRADRSSSATRRGVPKGNEHHQRWDQVDLDNASPARP